MNSVFNMSEQSIVVKENDLFTLHIKYIIPFTPHIQLDSQSEIIQQLPALMVIN